MDAVQAANSGHPGMPMGMAEIAVALWNRHLRHNPGQSALARSRSLRAVQRPRLDAAVRAAASDRLRPADRRAQAFPPAALEDAGPSGSRRHARRRDDDRPARPGARQRRRHGARRAAARRRVQPPGPRDRRSPHLRVRRRRLPDGRHLARGLLARRHAGPGQARSCFYDDNGISIDGDVAGLVHRRHAAALRGLRLARRSPTSTATTSTPSTRRSRGARVDRPADAHLLQDDHRQGRAERRRDRPRRTAQALGEKEVAATRAALGWTLSAVRDSAGRLRRLERARARRSARGGLGRALRRVSRPRIPTLAAEFERRIAGDAARRLRRDRRARSSPRRTTKAEIDRDAQGVAAGDRGVRAAAAGNDRRLGRPHRLGVHQLVGQQAGQRATRRATTSTSACANSR